MKRWLIVGMFALSAQAAEPPVCPTDGQWLEPTAYLKALSLDLRGVVPTMEEYEEVAALGEVPESWIDDWLADELFVERMVRFHRDLMWNNVSEAQLLSSAHRFRTTNGIYWRSSPADDYRVEAVYCGDFEATVVDGYPVPVIEPETGNRLEGWVWKSPYWDPESQIKVCAYDAQEREFSATGTDCSSRDGRNDPECGCGPELRWCGQTTVHKAVAEAFSEDLDRRVAENIRENHSYIDLMMGRYGYVNGPIVDYLRHRTGVPANLRFSEWPVDVEGLPDLDFSQDDEWVRVDLGEHHSGIFTSPAFLLRFQTNRARANRFYASFLCQPFQPPDTGLTGLDDPKPTLDLTARAGCNGCHALLEPAGAYWGRWTEQGGGYLDPEAFPAFDESCERCTTEGYPCSVECGQYYLTAPISSEQTPYVGWLNSFAFLDDAHQPHVEQGPKLLINRTVADGRLSECTTRKAVQFLLQRELRGDESEWLQDLLMDFIGSDYRYRDLYRAIVTSDNYRRLR